ncbi:MAG: TonB-dependent receptor plug domain-containing protein [Verrucomicrobiota bacterium]|nr:TonB-dependent receptor plug domain-containing protein [Verrucomicrobiota bacterium]
MTILTRSAYTLLVAAIFCPAAWGQDNAITQLEEVVVTGRSDSLIGVASSANEGVVGSEQLALRPLLRPGEIVETVPGVIVSQHSGAGKANQFYLRGFNLDHGTDLTTSVDGVPINMRTHAHGQGYTDLNFLIPEFVREVGYKKGPYYAEEGDFASAGAFNIELFDRLERGFLTLEGGTDGYARLVFGHSVGLGAAPSIFGKARTARVSPRRAKRLCICSTVSSCITTTARGITRTITRNSTPSCV